MLGAFADSRPADAATIPQLGLPRFPFVWTVKGEVRQQLKRFGGLTALQYGNGVGGC